VLLFLPSNLFLVLRFNSPQFVEENTDAPCAIMIQQAHPALDGVMFSKDTSEDAHVVDKAVE